MSDNCPFCEPRTSWGMSPEAWDSMREWHEKAHPEVKLKVNDVVEIDPDTTTSPSNPPLETEPSLRDSIFEVCKTHFPIGTVVSKYSEDGYKSKLIETVVNADATRIINKTVDEILKAIEDSIGDEFDYGDKLATKALGIKFMAGYNHALTSVRAKLRGDS